MTLKNLDTNQTPSLSPPSLFHQVTVRLGRDSCWDGEVVDQGDGGGGGFLVLLVVMLSPGDEGAARFHRV